MPPDAKQTRVFISCTLSGAEPAGKLIVIAGLCVEKLCWFSISILKLLMTHLPMLELKSAAATPIRAEEKSCSADRDSDSQQEPQHDGFMASCCAIASWPHTTQLFSTVRPFQRRP